MPARTRPTSSSFFTIPGVWWPGSVRSSTAFFERSTSRCCSFRATRRSRPGRRRSYATPGEKGAAVVIVVETDRLHLRRVELDDAAFLLDLLNQPSFLHFIGDKGVRTLDDARDYILTGPLASYERFGFGMYLTVLKEDRIPIGI